jgi:drug/metabolite transporter (DMT)-like permease
MILYTLFVFFLIGSAFCVNKMILVVIQPDLFVFLRMGVSGLLLLLFYCREKKIYKFGIQHFGLLTLIAFFTTFMPSLFRSYALQNITSSRAAFWGTFEPFVTALYMYLLFKKPLKPNQMIACFIGFLGGILFILLDHNTSGTTKQFLVLADIAQIVSVFFSRYGWIKAQEVLQKNEVTPQQLNGLTFTISGLLSLALNGVFSLTGCLYKGLPVQTISSLLHVPWGLKLYSLFFYTIVIGNMIAYTLYGILLKKFNASYVAIAGLSVPFFVHCLGYLFLEEQFAISYFFPLSLIAVALYVFNKKE